MKFFKIRAERRDTDVKIVYQATIQAGHMRRALMEFESKYKVDIDSLSELIVEEVKGQND